MAKTTMKSNNKEDISRARDLEISVADYRVLKALDKSTMGLTYREIQDKTGYYNNLPSVCKGSLVEAKLAKEISKESDSGRSVTAFQILAKGKKLLTKKVSPKATETAKTTKPKNDSKKKAAAQTTADSSK